MRLCGFSDNAGLVAKETEFTADMWVLQTSAVSQTHVCGTRSKLAKAAARLGVWATGESHTFFGHNLTVSSDACASQRVHAFADNDARVSLMEAAGTCLCATALARRADLNQQNL